MLFLVSATLGYQKYDGTRVVRVVDGDTVDLRDGRRVRLLGIDAPEIGRCMAMEASQRLATLTQGKHLKLRHAFSDEYGRTLADVFVGDTFINEILVKEGLARFRHAGNEYDGVLLREYTSAETGKLGIFSTVCRTTIPTDGNTVKGNLRSGRKLYYPATCKYYDQVVVDTSYGDQWFGTELEAQEEGYTLSPTCFGK
jgi:endonuclease YncB( thermonuclease family)